MFFPGAEISSVVSTRSPDFTLSLWQLTQYLLSTA